MIKLYNKVPKDVVVACSGGVDSMVLTDFLKRKHNVSLAFFHHGTSTSEEALKFVSQYANDNELYLHIGYMSSEVPKGASKEDYWRKERYKFLNGLGLNTSVVTGHHLDDAVETWIWSSLHGQSKLIPYNNKNVIRPLLLNEKDKLYKWANDKNVPYIEDNTNTDTNFIRNHIRHNMMEDVFKVNPGIRKTIRKKYLNITNN